MARLTYTNIIGTFVFSDKKIVEEKLFNSKEILEYSKRSSKDEKIVPPSWILDFFNQKKYLARIKEAATLITKRRMAESVNFDNLIIQAVNNVDEIDKVANGLSKRLREWYELYNPEFSKSIESHEKFAELIQKKTKKELLKEVGVAVSESMGAELSQKDLAPIMELAKEISSLFDLRAKQVEYIEKSMKDNLPNITAVCGGIIGAKLLAVAGSIEKMALFPASTIQLLGAETALFRHIKTGARSPKYGIIINHPLVSHAKQDEKGKAARTVADKISIAAKIDYFKGEFRGDDLRKELEEKLK